MKREFAQRIPRKSIQAVAQIDTADLDRSKVKWDDLRVFAQVAEAKSLRAAASSLGVQTSTVSRRMQELEEALGRPLIARSSDGVHLTDAGQEIYTHVRALGLAVTQIERRAQSVGPEISGRVRLSVTEGLGTYWVLPRSVEFQRANPHLLLDVRCSMELSKTINVESDLAVQFERPKNPELKAMRLGTLHVILFASRGYQKRFGLPKSAAEFARHKFVSQTATQVDERSYVRGLGVKEPEGMVSYRVNSSAAHYAIIKKGGGIGALPTYIACLDRALVPIEVPQARSSLEIWLTYHPVMKSVPSVMATIDFIQECFDKSRFPWFKSEYVPVETLRKLPRDDWAMNMVDFN